MSLELIRLTKAAVATTADVKKIMAGVDVYGAHAFFL